MGCWWITEWFRSSASGDPGSASDGRGLIGRLALLVNMAAFVLTGDLTWAIVLAIINHLHVPATGLSGQMVIVAQVFPAPLILLIMAIFYLWVYARRSSHSPSSTEISN